MITRRNGFGLSFFVDSSDDSYVSAEEDPMEAPVFEFHLQDTVASSGADVILRCIIAGNPIPEGSKLYPVFLLYLQKTQLCFCIVHIYQKTAFLSSLFKLPGLKTTLRSWTL